MEKQTKKVIDRLINQLQFAPNFQVGRIRREIRRLLKANTEADGVVIQKVERIRRV